MSRLTYRHADGSWGLKGVDWKTLAALPPQVYGALAKLKDMETGDVSEVALDDSLYTTLYNKSLDRQLAGMADLFGEELSSGLEK